jgi:hypothetical protein
MIKKKVTVIVLGADQKLWTGGKLRLKVTDLRKDLKSLKSVSFPGTSNIIEVNLDLPFDAGQAYGIQVDAEDHRSAWQIIKRRTFLREEGGQQVEIDNAIFRLTRDTPYWKRKGRPLLMDQMGGLPTAMTTWATLKKWRF